MCLAIPLKVIEIDGKYALGEAGGLTQQFRIDFLPKARVGDHVMVHAGFGIEIIDEQEEERTHERSAEIFNAVSD